MSIILEAISCFVAGAECKWSYFLPGYTILYQLLWKYDMTKPGGTKNSNEDTFNHDGVRDTSHS